MALQRTELLMAPFPWFGGKSAAAELVWEHLGIDIRNYVEPFFGSGAVLLNMPDEVRSWAVVNDLDGFVANFWRAIAADFETVALHSDAQVNEFDLQARHQYLVDQKEEMTRKLKEDPEYFDARIAGWWAWGCCSWIGGGWCADKRVSPSGGFRSVKKQLPRIGNGGQGVNRQLPYLPNGARGDRASILNEWFSRIKSKLREARVTCGDWERICTVSVMTGNGPCAVFLDPPYGTTPDVYAVDSRTVAEDVRRWCLENGNNLQLRIALCGHVGQHEILESSGWSVALPKSRGGYQGADDRERIWFSPGCLRPAGYTVLSLF